MTKLDGIQPIGRSESLYCQRMGRYLRPTYNHPNGRFVEVGSREYEEDKSRRELIRKLASGEISVIVNPEDLIGGFNG